MIEAELDFADEDDVPVFRQRRDREDTAGSARKSMNISRARPGEIIRDGLRIVIPVSRTQASRAC